jgi:hypothetical protein
MSLPPEARSASRWTRLSDTELLQMRFCDLRLQLRGTGLETRLHRVHDEMARRGLGFRPHMWLAEEWFSPDGVPGIAVPFYLAHPRLIRLERRMMRQVEGGNQKWMMRILRHEVGHAIDYPESYRARPGSRRYVQHLGDWYAQAHPTEDFAETFAVWLKPNSDWRRSYASWPAWDKLRYVDELMHELAAAPPLVTSRAHVEPLAHNRRTLAEHYREKLARQIEWCSEASDTLLLRVFTRRPARRGLARAAAFLRSRRRELLAGGVRNADAYNLQQVLRIAIERADELGLYLRGSQRDAVPHARWLLAGMARLFGERERPQLNL